ncbi:MAG: hypothetical protein ABR567_18235 [Myxococcales bacterium]
MKNILIVILAAACGGAPVKPLPAYYTAANVDHPRFPRSRYVAGIGLSTLGAEDADQRAAVNVSAQISAQLQSETSSFQEYTSKTADTAERVRSTSSVRTSFDRADLIRVVERERQGETFYSYAVLDRAATDRELANAAGADLASFNAAAESAMKARADGDTGVFSTAASEAARIRPRLDASFIVRRAVAGRAAEEAAYVTLRNELLALLEQARARRVVGVVLRNNGNGHLADFTVNAVKHLGLRPDTAPCDKRDKKDLTDATMLEVDPEENCSEGSLGERCEVTVHLVAQACAGATSGAGTVALVRGVHPSDRDKARKSAWDKVTQQAIEAAVRDALKSAIQIGE